MMLLLSYLWKLPLCALGFMFGLMVSGALLLALGFTAPALPAGTEENLILLWNLVGSLVMALALGRLSRSLQAGFSVRWLALSALAWSVSALSTVLEAAIFMDTGTTATSGSVAFAVASFLLPCLALAGLAAGLFPPAGRVASGWQQARDWWASRPAQAWWWQLAAAWIAFPIIYVAFGLLVQPFIADYYSAGQFELAAPTWGQILPLQLVRSALFLIVCLPIVAAWRGSRRGLAVTLGLALFVLLGFMPVITSYWFPWQLRLFHGLELLAAALAYAGLLAWLLAAPNDAVAVHADPIATSHPN